MIIRLFLALLALLTGVTPAQSAVSISSSQTAVGATATVDPANSSILSKQANSYKFDEIWPNQVKRTIPLSFGAIPLDASIAPPSATIFIGDRQRT
jgi:hypothetical protein